MITCYGIPNCDTVKKARQWLTEHHLPYRFHDFRKDGIDLTLLSLWSQHLDWQQLLNRRGTSWRKLTPAAQASAVDAASATALMLATPSLIKRPVLHWQDTAKQQHFSVGFDPALWQTLFLNTSDHV